MNSLEGLEVVELRDLLKAKNLPIYGKKEVLVKRLRDFIEMHDEKESVEEMTVGVEDIAFVDGEEGDVEVAAESEALVNFESEKGNEVSWILMSSLNTSLSDDLSVNDLSKIDFEVENLFVEQLQMMNDEALIESNKDDRLFDDLLQPGIRKPKQIRTVLEKYFPTQGPGKKQLDNFLYNNKKKWL